MRTFKIFSFVSSCVVAAVLTATPSVALDRAEGDAASAPEPVAGQRVEAPEGGVSDSSPSPRVVPSSMPFQGFLTDNAGTPIGVGGAVPVNIVAELHTDAVLPSLVWGPEFHVGVPVEDGVFTVELGNGVPLPLAIFGPGPLWLQLSVNGEPPLPRTRLLSAPFAFRAGVADVADIAIADDGDWTIAGSDVYRIPGNVGIGTGSPAQKLHVSGDIRLDNGTTSAVTTVDHAEGKWLDFQNSTGVSVVAGGSSNADGAGFLQLRDVNGFGSVEVDGDGDDTNNGIAAGLITVRSSGTGGIGGQVSVYNNNGTSGVTVLGGGSSGGGTVELFNSVNDRTILLDGEAATGGELLMYNDAGLITINVDSDNGGGADLSMANDAGATRVFLDGDFTDGGAATIYAADGSSTVFLVGQAADGAGEIQVRNNLSSTRILLDGESFGGGRIDVRQDNAASGILLRGEEFSGGGNGSVFEMYAEDGAEVLEIDSGFAVGGGNFYLDGNSNVTGTKSAIVDAAGERRLMYCTESSEVWFEEVGSGQLSGGVADITLDALFLDVVQVDRNHPLRVMVTLTDDCNGVYVQKRDDGFTVRELQGGASNATFDYKVIAKRAGYADVRMERYEDKVNEDPSNPGQRSMYRPVEGLGDPADGQAQENDEVRERPVRGIERGSASEGVDDSANSALDGVTER